MNTLLVPISVEAMLADSFAEDYKRVAAAAPDFRKLSRSILGSKIAQPPFSREDPLPAGVHLHFLVPDALTRGREIPPTGNQPGQPGQFEYPLLPDRWLVTRLIREAGPDGCRIRRRSWLVESDFVSDDPKWGGVPMPDFDRPGNYHSFLGRAYPLGETPAEERRHPRFCVFGNGDPTFAAYYPSCRSCLGFYDDLADAPVATLAYFVAGWHSRPKDDPLFQATPENLEETLAALEWSAKAGKTCPQRTVYHGLVGGLNWRGPNHPYPFGLPEGLVNVAIGNTSVEALSALVASSMPDGWNAGGDELERFLNALQYDILEEYDEVDGPGRVEDETHRRGFADNRQGSVWLLSPPVQAGGEAPPEVPAAGETLLEDLNAIQRRRDRLALEGDSVRNRMFAAWHTYFSKYESPSPFPDKKPFREDIHKEFVRLADELYTGQAGLDDLDALLTNAKAAIGDYLAREKLPHILEESEGEAFHFPNPPVLMFSGDGLSRSYIYGENGRFSDDGTLVCRHAGTGISALEFAVDADGVRIDADCLREICDPWPTTGGIPECSFDLLCETVLLDPDSAGFLAALAFRILKKGYNEAAIARLAENVRQLIEKPWAEVDTAGFSGYLPSRVAVNFWDGPPWHTLFLEWRVGYYPTRSTVKPDNSLDGWTLGDIDYRYERPLSQILPIPAFAGRTVATPHSQYMLADVLGRQIDRHPDDEPLKRKLREIADRVRDMRLLSQSLGDFSQRLAGLADAMQFPFMITSGQLREDERAVEMTQELAVMDDWETAQPDLSAMFFPIRAGFLKIERAELVSSFGGCQVVATTLGNPLVAEALRPPPSVSDVAVAALPPRISQGARLHWHWPDAGEEPSPVCGYVIPNQLNRGLMLYEADGTMLGTIQSQRHGGAISGTGWIPAPLSPYGRFEDINFANQHLKQFADHLRRDFSGGRSALEELLTFVDLRQGYTLLENGSHDRDLALLSGRPLALVRAAAELELFGRPAYDRGLARLGEYETNLFTQIGFALRVGDAQRHGDGLIGYFHGSAYDRLFAIDAAAPPPSQPARYLDYGRPPPPDLGEKCRVEMCLLMEPAGLLTIKTGILPVLPIRLPEPYYKDAMASMYQGFEINPVLMPPDRAIMPFAEDHGDGWSWAYRDINGDYIELPGIGPTAEAFPLKTQVLMDGHLVKRKGG